MSPNDRSPAYPSRKPTSANLFVPAAIKPLEICEIRGPKKKESLPNGYDETCLGAEQWQLSHVRRARFSARWLKMGVHDCGACHSLLGTVRPLLSFLRYLAARREYRHHDRYLFDRLSDSKHAKSRRAGDPSKTRREIIHSIKGARNEMIQIENLSDADLETISKNFEKIRAECQLRTSKNRLHAPE
jgi:hypothetical protein